MVGKKQETHEETCGVCWGEIIRACDKAGTAGIELEESKIDAKEVEDSIFNSC